MRQELIARGNPRDFTYRSQIYRNSRTHGGHAEGDRCLKQIADALRHTMRSKDDLVRYGSEEFAVILQDADLTEARQSACARSCTI